MEAIGIIKVIYHIWIMEKQMETIEVIKVIYHIGIMEKNWGFQKMYFLFRGLRFPRREQTSFGVLELVTESYSTYATVFFTLAVRQDLLKRSIISGAALMGVSQNQA